MINENGKNFLKVIIIFLAVAVAGLFLFFLKIDKEGSNSKNHFNSQITEIPKSIQIRNVIDENKKNSGFWYIVDSNGNIIAKINYKPDFQDLASRNEIGIFSSKDIPFGEAEYKDGKIIQHVLTKQEIIAKKKMEIEQIENYIVEIELEKEKAQKMNMPILVQAKQEKIDKLNKQLKEVRNSLEKLEQ